MPTALTTRIHRIGQPGIIGVTRNLSPHGAFVEIDHHTSLENGIIEIEFLDTPLRNLRLKGLIIHGNNGGVGIMFSDTNVNERAAIKKFVSKLSTHNHTPKRRSG
jgi:hypothetical protein